MKIVYLFNGRLPTEKAHGLQIVKMCEAFAGAGDSVTLLSSYRRNPIQKDIFSFYGINKNFIYRQVFGFDISWIPIKIAYYIQTLFSALTLVLYARYYENDGDIFYARDYWTLFLLSFFGHQPVAEIHDYRFKKKRGFVQTILNHSRKIIVNSKGTLELLKEHYLFDESKAIVVANGVDLDFFAINETPDEVRRALKMPLGTIIGYTGRLEAAGIDKGVGLLIEAMSLMKCPDTFLYVVGGPNNQAEALKNMVRELNLNKRVICTGHVHHAEIPRYLRAMDIVVIPLASNQHALTTSPIKLFEYLAAGKVIVASDLPSLKEIISSKEAIFFKPGDADNLAGQLDQIISNPSLATELAHNSLKRAEQYSWLGRAQAIKKFIVSDAN